METEKEILTIEQAMATLHDGDSIHVFLNPGGMLVGADWSRDEILELLNSSDYIEIGGEQCKAMKHGLVAWKDKRPHFIESKAGQSDH